jgi:hypothetical protein
MFGMKLLPNRQTTKNPNTFVSVEVVNAVRCWGVGGMTRETPGCNDKTLVDLLAGEEEEEGGVADFRGAGGAAVIRVGVADFRVGVADFRGGVADFRGGVAGFFSVGCLCVGIIGRDKRFTCRQVQKSMLITRFKIFTSAM